MIAQLMDCCLDDHGSQVGGISSNRLFQREWQWDHRDRGGVMKPGSASTRRFVPVLAIRSSMASEAVTRPARSANRVPWPKFDTLATCPTWCAPIASQAGRVKFE